MRRLIAALSLSLATTTAAQAADLSPGRWPADVRTKLEAREAAVMPSAARQVDGRKGLVAATMSPIAVHAGVEALRQGGTAADAAVTTALTQISTNLGSVVSYAGAAQLIYYDAKTKTVYAMDAGWQSYRGETSPATIPAADLSALVPGQTSGAGAQGRKTLVPGFMAGMAAMHDRFGKLPFATLLQPAIWYADKGVTLSPLLGTYFNMQQAYLARTPEGRGFMHPGGGDALPHAGELFRQPELAKTLRAVAAHGSAEMYTGAWAKAYVAAVDAAGGKASLDDMVSYRVTWDKPISTQFGDAVVMGPGVANAYSCDVLMAINLLNGAGAERLAPYWQDPVAFTTYAQAIQLAEYGRYTPQLAAFERAQGLGSTCQARLQPAYGAAVGRQMADLQTLKDAADRPGHHSDSVVAVDRWGNIAVLVHSINAVVWGDTGLVVGGIPVSNAAGLYKAQLAQIRPGDRLPNDMTPVIALRGGKPVVAVASIGTSLLPETVRLTAGLLAKPTDPASLMAAAPLLHSLDPFAGANLAGRAVAVPQGPYDKAFLDALRKEGLTIREEPADRVAALRGTAAILTLDPDGRRASFETPGVLDFAEGEP